MATIVNIDKQGDLRKVIAAARGVMTGSEAGSVAGYAAANRWREHFYEKDATPNRLGGRRTHYWAKAGDSVGFKVLGKSISITAAQVGLVHRYQGGTIKPKDAKLLTIPVNPKAHGHRAREFDLQLIRTGKGRGAKFILAKVRGNKKQLEVYYLLVPSVTQKADPTVLPPDGELERAGLNAIQSLTNARLRTAASKN